MAKLKADKAAKAEAKVRSKTEREKLLSTRLAKYDEAAKAEDYIRLRRMIKRDSELSGSRFKKGVKPNGQSDKAFAERVAKDRAKHAETCLNLRFLARYGTGLLSR